MHTEMYNKVLSLMDCGEFASFYFDESALDVFSFGQVHHLSEEWLILKHFTRLGDADGIKIRKSADLAKIEIGGQYEQSLQKLISAKKSTHNQSELRVPDDEVFSLSVAMQRMADLRALVEIWCNDDETPLVGYLETVVEIVSLLLIDRFGSLDGRAIIVKTDITALDLESRELQALRILSENV